MKKVKVLLTGLSQQDLKTARNYYKEISPNLAKAFLERIKEAKIFISENPLGNDISYKNVRTHLLKQFPYHVHYLIDESNCIIFIIAIEFAKRENVDFSERI